MVRVNYRLSSLLLVAFLLVSCGDDSGSGSSRRERAGKDRGEAAMTLGSNQWQAESAKAKLAGGRLTISASNMDTTGGKVQSQRLDLNITDYKGPGDYKTGFSGSRFIGVGIDVDAVKAAQGDDQKATEAITSALSGSSHLMLSNANVTITAANDTEISGTFSWQPPPGLKQPAIQNGTFRALVGVR